MFHDEISLHQLLDEIPEIKVITIENELKTLKAIKVKLLAKEKDLFETPVSVIFKRNDY